MVSELEVRNKTANTYDEFYINQCGYWHDWVEKQVMLKILDLKSSDTVLDAGCGTGRITLELAKRCKWVNAFDYSNNSIKVLSRKIWDNRVYNITILNHDIATYHLPFEYKFDKVISVQVIQHLKSVDRYRAIDNLYSYLKPKGTCVILMYNATPFYFGSLINKPLERNGEFESGIPYHRFYTTEIKEMFSLAGFKNISIKGCVNVSFYNYMNSKIFYPLALLDAWLSRFVLSCKLGTYLIVKGEK
jgi:ubiquinone/menaquinone biosynthesis C-methylase UbiE